MSALAGLVSDGRLEQPALPLPGSGRTMERYSWLARVASHDVALARVVEGHADAIAILAEAGAPPPSARSTLGVWAAGPEETLLASRSGGGWRLRGLRRWCSGAGTLSHALVTAVLADVGPPEASLFFIPVDTEQVVVDRSSWPAVGMARTDTFDISIDGLVVPESARVGPPGWYAKRPGFWHGAVGVAACWWGAASAAAEPLVRRAAMRDDPHARAAHGEVAARLFSMESAIAAAAEAFDADPLDTAGTAARLAQLTRIAVERAAGEVLRQVGDATGAEPLCHDLAHATRVADLTVYLRQHHGARDAETLSRLINQEGPPS